MIRHRSIRGAALAVLAASALAIAACGSSGGGSSADGKTSMTWFMWTGSSAEVQGWKHLANMVHAKYPDITLTFETTSFNDYWTKLAAEASGGDAPCILGMQSLRTPQFGTLLKPLNPLMAKAGVVSSQFDQSIMKGLQVNGQQVAIPYDFGPYLMYYNKTAFQKAGLTLPAPGWTTAQFLADAKKLTKGKQYGFAAFPYPDYIIPWSMSNDGLNPVTASGTTEFTNAKFEQAMQWYMSLVQKQKIAAPVPATNNSGWPQAQYLAGDAAMVVDGPWDLINTKAEAKFAVGIAPMPAGADGSRSVSAGSGFGISDTCKTPSQAMQAISVITSPAAEQYLGTLGRAFPARTAQQKYWYKNAVPGAQTAMDAALQGAAPYLTTTKWNAVSQLFMQYGVQAMNGQMSVPTFVSNVDSQTGGS